MLSWTYVLHAKLCGKFSIVHPRVESRMVLVAVLGYINRAARLVLVLKMRDLSAGCLVGYRPHLTLCPYQV